MGELHKEIFKMLNEHTRENDSNSLDFILAEYLMGCMEVFETVITPKIQSQGQRISPTNTDSGIVEFKPDLRKPGDRRQENIEFKAPDKRQLLDRRNFPVWKEEE